ncbi:hypothetical protein NHX12_029025 [Muraenolepis orangiensis]|uniref:EF-hand domain-containing protein n=1 Tax=Muraenolepis orangiensis TaxID=630683 RepID=A0A9Q0IMP9_9TELE|nr:hypothetical protein NHX12_029025 [Muraenolepis orangiensis]
MSAAEEQERLRALFHAYDVDRSGRIERNEFFTICSELRVPQSEAESIFERLDVDRDATVTLEEFISGFHGRFVTDGSEMEEDGVDDSVAWEAFERRLGDQAMFIPRKEQAATLYLNISLTEPRLIPQLERVILNFTKEIKQHNSEMENLALAVKRAQDQATMQLSEMEEEMDHRIHAAEKKSRQQEMLRTDTALNELRRSYETEICELQCKIQRMQAIEEKFKHITNKDESFSLKKRINEFTIENQRLKQDLLKSQTNISCLQSEMDSLKTDLTDQSMNSERDEVIMKNFSDESANRKLHDSNDGLRTSLERSGKTGSSGSVEEFRNKNRSKSICYTSPYSLIDRFYDRMEEAPLGSRRPSCEALALAMCDPGLRRRLSNEYEEDSLPESCMDSGLSTLRGSHGGEYDSEPEVKDNSDVDPTETQDVDSQFGSDSGSALDWNPAQSVSRSHSGASTTTRKALTASSSQERPTECVSLGFMTSEKAYRIVLAGDAAVGKSSFLLRLCKNEFKLNGHATLGVDFQMKTLTVDGEFRSIAKSYFRRADGVLLLYDVTCERSFLNVREWVDMIEDISHDDIPIMLVGNKCDMRQQETYNALFCETSAKDGSNVLEAVLHLAREVTKKALLDDNYNPGTTLKPSRNQPNFSCCT